MRHEGDEDSQRECGEYRTPDEAQVVAMFAALFGVNILLVADVGAEPVQRANPSGLLLALLRAPLASGRFAWVLLLLAPAFILSYAFLCVHNIYNKTGAKVQNYEQKAKKLRPFYSLLYIISK